MTESRTRSWSSVARPPIARPWPSRQSAVGDRRLDTGREVEQAERVGDGRAGTTDAGREAILGEPELVDELAIRVGGLDRVEVLALEVLDERELELIAIGQLAHERRDPVEAGGLRRAQPPLTGDELVAVDRLGHEDRLEDAVLRDARRERRETVRIEPLARLMRVGLIRDVGISSVAGLAGAALRDQRGEPAAEALRALRVGPSRRHRFVATGRWLAVDPRPSRARSSVVESRVCDARRVESGA